MLVIEETFLSMCRCSRAIIFRFNSKTQWQMFLLLYARHVCVPQKDTNMASLYKAQINLSKTLLQITREWKTTETWFLARLFICPSLIVSQIHDFIHWMVTILVLIMWLLKTKNTLISRNPGWWDSMHFTNRDQVSFSLLQIWQNCVGFGDSLVKRTLLIIIIMNN